uniref:Mitochondrial citrate transport protein, putative n=1 Tax=Riptortus pedestris TaxID=329032 RepID=R4WPJ6_RIPPE|nr:mitochondrial citrate transport protein, putative [Riptortus pedestris]
MYTSMPLAVRMMVKNEGYRSFFKGLTPALLCVAPQTAAIFTFHNLITKLVSGTRLTADAELKVFGNLVVGSLAGLLGKTVVYPLDLTRKRLQLQGFEGRKGFGENFSCRGMFDCLITTTQKEGFLGLYKGLSPSILKAAVTTALHFTVYDETCKILSSVRMKRSV